MAVCNISPRCPAVRVHGSDSHNGTNQPKGTTHNDMKEFKSIKEAEQHIKDTAGINGMSEECAVIIESGTGNTFFVYWDCDGIF